MRHRCLRVASVLVPQESLEEVLTEDEFSSNDLSCSLPTCSFGAFCAKELEEMSLPIPHSDLVQLSQMHFPSYARALWRHHRDMKGAKGRLLLLILELYLKESISDYSFFLTIVKEIESLRLPRTLLLAFESIVRYIDKIPSESLSSFMDATDQHLLRALSQLSQFVQGDIQKVLVAMSDNDNNTYDTGRDDIVKTLTRLGRIIGAFSSLSGVQSLLREFNNGLLDLAGTTKILQETRKEFYEILEHGISKINDKEIKSELFGQVCTLYPSYIPNVSIETKLEDAGEPDFLASILLPNQSIK